MGPDTLGDALEQGKIVYFPESPVPFPGEDDLRFLREEIVPHLREKNLSYHPEAGRVLGLARRSEHARRAHRILKAHAGDVQDFLSQALPGLSRDGRAGTSSFRPFQERGRDLPLRASNERVHFDARAYGATKGDRILRFFMNAHPSEDRLWISKGVFPDVYRRYGARAGIAPPEGRGHDLAMGRGDRLLSAFLQGLSHLGLPLARLAENSPYDRLMRKLHNSMKEDGGFQSDPEGHCELRFPPRSAWMVFTDMVSHACIEGQHAFIDTFLLPLGNCRFPEMAPYFILRGIPARPGN